MTLAALGALVGANVLLFYVAAVAGYLTEKLAREWIAIGLRVAGSWIAAISFIVLALSLSRPLPSNRTRLERRSPDVRISGSF